MMDEPARPGRPPLVQQVKSLTHSTFGAGARNWRLTRSSDRVRLCRCRWSSPLCLE